MDLGDWVKAARASKGWTLEQLGEKLGTTKANVSHWERKRHEPSFAQVQRIAEMTGYPLEPLLIAAEPPPPWPLPTLDRERLERLSPADREFVGDVAMLAIEQRERLREEARKKKQRGTGT